MTMSDSSSRGAIRTTLCRLAVLFILIATPILPSLAAQSEVPQAEYDALVALYNATDGAIWGTPWTLPTDFPCALYGVTCTGGHVSAIGLAWNNLSGTIPAALSDLTELQDLDLSFNQLSGAIPPELSGLANLESLSFGYNELSGTIPPQLGGMIAMRELSLYENQLNGAIPSELGNLTLLEGLNLYGNQLSGAIPPELGNLSSLIYFWADDNQLSGAIPPELGSLSGIRQLSLSYNQLSGAIPSELGGLAGAFQLLLDHNQLSGAIPPELGNLAGLGVLALSHNQLSGTIPEELGSLSQLQTLGVSNNQLGGPVPPALANLVSLSSVDIGYNRLWTDDAAVKAFLDAKDPDWAATQDAAAAPVTPEAGGQATLPNPDGGSIAVVAPSGVVTETVTLAIMPLAPPSSNPDGLRLYERAFSLGAYRNSTLLDGFAFGAPVTVTLTYTDEEADGLEEDTLTLYVRQGDDWVDAANTCTPASSYLREPEANRLSAPICHLSEFALFGKGEFSYYLPVMRRR